MSYTVALTKTGQMTLPKALRIFLGVDGAKTIRLEQTRNGVEIRRKMTYEEFRTEMDKHISSRTREILKDEKQNGGRPPVREIMKEIAKSPEAQKRWEEKYGV